MVVVANLYIIGGANGAGKTTAARELLPHHVHCYEFVNADAIAAGLSPFRPESVAIQAGRLMLQRIRSLAEAGQDFAFESTLASRSFLPFIRNCIDRGIPSNCYIFGYPMPKWRCNAWRTGWPQVVIPCREIPSSDAMTPEDEIAWTSIFLCVSRGRFTIVPARNPNWWLRVENMRALRSCHQNRGR